MGFDCRLRGAGGGRRLRFAMRLSLFAWAAENARVSRNTSAPSKVATFEDGPKGSRTEDDDESGESSLAFVVVDELE